MNVDLKVILTAVGAAVVVISVFAGFCFIATH